MRIAILISIIFACAILQAEDDAHVKKLFEHQEYQVQWGKAEQFDPNSVLEIGTGSGHGFSLDWWRFLPNEKSVTVLAISLDRNRTPYDSKFPPDNESVTITSAELSSEGYRVLLKEIALAQAAILTKLPEEEPFRRYFSSNNFWVNAQLFQKSNVVLDLDWAGYHASNAPIQYAKPKAAVTLAQSAIAKLQFNKHELTAAERQWASEKFIRDWAKFKKLEEQARLAKQANVLDDSARDNHWWVSNRYLIVIGFCGDEKTYPPLLQVLEESSDKHDVYQAINAVTRLTKTDLREKPVEEMKLETIKPKYIELLKKVR